MVSKSSEKALAIKLRREGKTYREILSVVPVAKSSLSLWLREVGLSKAQKQTITKKRQAAQKRGATQRKQDRLGRTSIAVTMASASIGSLSPRERLLIGSALYWAEGAKAKVHRPTVGIDFANSDPEMIKFFMRWLREALNVSIEDVVVVLHIHENHLNKLEDFKLYWSTVTRVPVSQFAKPVVKTHKPKTKRKNIGETYRGLVAIRVRRSTMLNRTIFGWMCGIMTAK
jgi:hypothetical protein